jgi:hypothetical protein
MAAIEIGPVHEDQAEGRVCARQRLMGRTEAFFEQCRCGLTYASFLLARF